MRFKCPVDGCRVADVSPGWLARHMVDYHDWPVYDAGDYVAKQAAAQAEDARPPTSSPEATWHDVFCAAITGYTQHEHDMTAEQVVKSAVEIANEADAMMQEREKPISQAGSTTAEQSPVTDLAGEMAEALRWFCGRVEAGEVRSVNTYKRFKELLDKADAMLTERGKERGK